MLYKTLKIGKNDTSLSLVMMPCFQFINDLIIRFLISLPQEHEDIMFSDMLTVFHMVFQLKHPSVSFTDAFKLYNQYVADGNTHLSFAILIMDMLKSHYLYKDDDLEPSRYKASRLQRLITNSIRFILKFAS